MNRRVLVALGALPPTPEDFARVMYPSLKAVLGPQFAAAGVPMPDTFDENPPEVRAKFIELVRPILADALNGGSR